MKPLVRGVFLKWDSFDFFPKWLLSDLGKQLMMFRLGVTT